MKIITLCGSTRFHELFAEYYVKLAMEGWTVLTIPASFQVKGENKGLSEISKEIKERLDECHKEKISLSDAIFVLNKDGYIGESTASEISFALTHHKDVIYLEPNVKHECTKCIRLHDKSCAGTTYFKSPEHYFCITDWARFKNFESGTRFMDA